MVARESGRSVVSMCGMAANQKEAYNRVEVFDLEADGTDGSLRINITSSTVVLEDEEEYVQLTGCREPSELSVRLHPQFLLNREKFCSGAHKTYCPQFL